MNEMNKAERIARLLSDTSGNGDTMCLAMLAEELCGERISWRLSDSEFTPIELPKLSVFYWRSSVVVYLGRNNTNNECRFLIVYDNNMEGIESSVGMDRIIYVRAANTTEIIEIAERYHNKINELIERGSIR